MPNQTKTQGNTKLDVKNIDYFYRKFSSEHKKYRPAQFQTDKKTKLRRKQPVSFSLFKKIIKEYFKLYFFDLYTDNAVLYFPLGGFLKKVTYPTWTHFMSKGKSKKQRSGGQNAIGLFWFLRPSAKMFYLVKLKKLTGSTNRLPKVEENYNRIYNKDLLPIFKSELKKGRKNKTLFICTLT